MKKKNDVYISAVILTLNEENNIKNCIKSLAWADEIVVIDSGSTDNTVARAKKLEARVLTHIRKPFNAATQRNWALRNANLKGEWVLFVDADEIITAKLAERIRKEIDNVDDKIIGFQLAPKFIFMGKWLKRTMGYPNWHDRIVRKGKLFYDKFYPIEKFVLTNHFGVVKKIPNPYLHFGFNNGITNWIQKHNRYSTNLAYRTLEVNCISKSRSKKEFFRLWLNRHIFIGPPLIVIYYLIIKRGILDGLPGIIYSLMYCIYQFMTSLKVLELKYRKRGLKM